MGERFSAEEFYKGFRGASINPDAREEWKEYRKAVTEFILANSDPGSSLTIYGAGRCDDLELAELSGHFSRVTLADYMYDDTTDVELCKIAKNIICVNLDMVGIPRGKFLCFIDYFKRNIGLLEMENGEMEFRDRLLDIVREAYKNRSDVSGSAGELREGLKADYSVILGVHSQLNNSFSGIWNYVLAALAPYENTRPGVYESCRRLMADIEMEQRRHTQEIVHSVNDFVIAGTRKAFFAGYELFLKNSNVNTDGPLAVEGAWQCSHDLEEREKAGKIHNTAFIRPDWPLDARRGICYAMAVGVWEV